MYTIGTPFAKELNSVESACDVLQIRLQKNWPEQSFGALYEYVELPANQELEPMKIQLNHLKNPTGALIDIFFRKVGLCRNTKQSVGSENQTCEIFDEVILLDFSVYEKAICGLIEDENDHRSFCSSYLTFSWVKNHFNIEYKLRYPNQAVCIRILLLYPYNLFLFYICIIFCFCFI